MQTRIINVQETQQLIVEILLRRQNNKLVRAMLMAMRRHGMMTDIIPDEYARAGKRDRAGRWYPDSEKEYRECCDNIRRPSRSWGNTLFNHAKSVEHCCAVAGCSQYASYVRSAFSLLSRFSNAPSKHDVRKVFKLLAVRLRDDEEDMLSHLATGMARSRDEYYALRAVREMYNQLDVE